MSNIVWHEKDLGPVDAYAEAVAAGYTGTRAEWLLEVGSVKENAQAATGAAAAAAESETAAAGSATAAAASAADALQHTQDVIESWLEDRIDPETGYALDRTLALNNAAAPADMVGDLKSAFNAQMCPVEFAPNIANGSYYKFADGATASSTKYARTNALWYGYGSRSAVFLNSNVYECAVAYYDATGTTSGTGYQGHDEYFSGVHYIPEIAVIIGVSFRRIDQDVLTTADITAISAALSAYAPTDTTKSINGMAADAKAVGYGIYVLQTEIDNNEENLVGTEIQFADGIINTSAAVGETTSLTRSANSGMQSAYAECVAGDKFVLTGVPNQNNSQRYFMFTDPELKVLKKSTGWTDSNNRVVTADADGYIIINFRKSYQHSAYKNVGRLTQDEIDLADVIAKNEHLENIVYATPFTQTEDAFVKTVNRDIDSKTLVVGIVADTHYTSHEDYGKYQLKYAHAFSKITDRIGVDFSINLGDLIDSDYDDLVHDGQTTSQAKENANVTVNKDRIGEMMCEYRSISPMLYCMAHHERFPYLSNGTGDIAVYKLDREVVDGLCNRSNKYLQKVHRTDDPLSSSYYVDFPNRKIRALIIDTTSYTTTGITPNDCTFFTSAITNLPEGYKVAIFTHCPFVGLSSGTILGYWESRVKPTLLAAENAGKVLAYFCGHVHLDNIITPMMLVEDDPTNSFDFPVIWFDAQKMDARDEEYVSSKIGNPYRSIRKFGEVSEYLFDIACIHLDTGIINLHRFGAGKYKTRTYNANTGEASFTEWD